jgi:hypothetical protein
MISVDTVISYDHALAALSCFIKNEIRPPNNGINISRTGIINYCLFTFYEKLYNKKQ